MLHFKEQLKNGTDATEATDISPGGANSTERSITSPSMTARPADEWI
jgi:hypothetical protein